MKIINTNDVSLMSIKALIYGTSGIGKTTLAKTLDSQTLILSFEGGLLSLRGTGIDVIDCVRDDDGALLSEIERLNKLWEIFDWLEGDEAKAKYDNIFVDSLTEIADSFLKHLEKKHANNKNKYDIWRELAQGMEKIVRRFRDSADYNFFFTALEENKGSEGAPLWFPQFPGNVTTPKVIQSFDEVWRMGFDQDGNRKLFCQPGIGYRGKSRLSLEVEEPNLQEIINKLFTEEKKENEQ